MSRNLVRSTCEFCDATPTLDEEPHPITRENAGGYFDEYIGMIVANATCPDCGARYLAWIDERPRFRRFHPRYANGTFVVLSHRASFNDEPAPEDLPTRWAPVVEARRRSLVSARSDLESQRDGLNEDIAAINPKIKALSLDSIRQQWERP